MPNAYVIIFHYGVTSEDEAIAAYLDKAESIEVVRRLNDEGMDAYFSVVEVPLSPTAQHLSSQLWDKEDSEGVHG